MRPHTDDFYRIALLVHLVHQTVFEIDTPGISLHIA